MRVITFSTKFPVNHPRKGEHTDFVQKIWKGLNVDAEYNVYIPYPTQLANGKWRVPVMWRDNMNDENYAPKHHTIRAGNRWKVGDMFSPRIWSGKPYASKQIEFAPPIEIKKIWNFCLTPDGYLLADKKLSFLGLQEVAKNDGLLADDFETWFAVHPKVKKEGFFGQVLCWNENINY